MHPRRVRDSSIGRRESLRGNLSPEHERKRPTATVTREGVRACLPKFKQPNKFSQRPRAVDRRGLRRVNHLLALLRLIHCHPPSAPAISCVREAATRPHGYPRPIVAH